MKKRHRSIVDLRAEEEAQDAIHGEDEMINPIPHDYLEYELADWLELESQLS